MCGLHMIQPYPVIYMVANLVRGLLDRKRSEEHLQSSNESIKTKTSKNDIKKQMPERIIGRIQRLTENSWINRVRLPILLVAS